MVPVYSERQATRARIIPSRLLNQCSGRCNHADKLDAVLASFAFLRYWGKATAAELKDGVFSEVPLEYETAEEWWTDFICDHLGAVPTIEPPNTESGFWRFTGTPGLADLNENGWKVVFGRGAETVRECNRGDGGHGIGGR